MTPRIHFVVVALVLACGPDKLETTAEPSTGTAGSTSPNTGTTTDGPVLDTTSPTTNSPDETTPLASCACVVIDGDSSYFDRDLCGGGPCGAIELACDDSPVTDHPYCYAGGRPILDITALDCAIDQLIAGTPGLIEYTGSPDAWFAFDGALVKVGEDRLGLTYSYEGFDVAIERSAHERTPLRDPTYFVGCQALTDPYQRFRCLADWSAGPVIEACDAPTSDAAVDPDR